MSLSNQAQSRSELSLLADPSLLAKRIAQLEAAEEQANSVLSLVGPANQILAIRGQVDHELEEAKEAVAEMKEGAAQVVALAQQQSIDIKTEAETQARSIIQGADARDIDAQERQAQAQENLAETEREQSRLRSWDADLGEKETALDERGASLTETESSLLKEKAQLAQIREQIDTILR